MIVKVNTFTCNVALLTLLFGIVVHTTHSSSSLLELLLPLPSLLLCLLSSHSPSLPACLPLSRFLPIWTRRLTTLTYLMRCQDLLGPGTFGECLTFSILGTLLSSGSTSESHELLAIHIPNFTLLCLLSFRGQGILIGQFTC